MLAEQVTAKQFGLFRIAFGIYLVCHFGQLIPYSAELFSRLGAIPDPSVNLSYGFFPNFLWLWDSPLVAYSTTSIGLLLSFLFALGVGRRWSAVGLWLILACLFHRNNFIENPGQYYTGWMLLACALVPAGESYALLRKPSKSWVFPRLIFHGAWIIMGVSYTISGLDKYFNSPSWASGTAVALIAQTPLALPSVFLGWFHSLPLFVKQIINHATLYSEILSLPLILFLGWRGRLFAWVSMLAAHLGILAILWLPDLTVSMILFHWFIFDNRWISKLSLPLLNRMSKQFSWFKRTAVPQN